MDTSKELRIFYKRMFSSNYFSSASFDFNETRIVFINCYVPIIVKFDTTFYICKNTMTAPKRPAPKCPRAQTAAPKRRRPNGGAQKSRTRVFHHPSSRALGEDSMGLFSTRMLILQHQSWLAAGSAPPGSEGRPYLSQPVPTSRRASSGPHPKRLP